MPVFIDPSRGTNGAGTFADPRNTWAGVTWSAGEQYLQKEGTTFAGNISVGASGSAGNEIILGTYDAVTGARITDNTRHATIAPINTSGINANNRTDIVIDNLRIVAAGDAAGRNALIAQMTDSSTAQRLVVRRLIAVAYTGATLNIRGQGVVIEDSNISCQSTVSNPYALYLICSNVEVRRNTLIGVAYDAVEMRTTANTVDAAINAVFSDNTAYTVNARNDGFTVNIRGRGVQVERNNIPRSDGDAFQIVGQNIVFRYNDCRNFDAKQVGGPGDGMKIGGTHDMLSVLVEHNIFVGHTNNPDKQCLILGEVANDNPQTGPITVRWNTFVGMNSAVILNANGARFYWNDVSGSVGAGVLAQSPNVKIWCNVVRNCGGRGISAAADYAGIEVYNNYVSSYGTCLASESGNAQFRNNACESLNTSTAQMVLDVAALATYSNNAYSWVAPQVQFRWGNTVYTSFAAYQAASSQDSNSLTGDLQTTTDGRPLPGSPLLTGGVDLGPRRDIRGYLARRFIGAYGPAVLLPSFS